MEKRVFGQANEETVYLFSLRTPHGMQVEITNFGGIITRIIVPDKNGELDDVTLGFDSLDPYLQKHPFFGALVGRYANRIANGKFTLNGKEYTLAQNNGPNALHGGLEGFDKKVWQAKEESANGTDTLTLSCQSTDGEEGYPGSLSCTVTYCLRPDNELWIHYHATTDKPTPINLTNHTYFNLHGHKAIRDVGEHVVSLNADKFTPVNENMIPTGEIINVDNTPLDFRIPSKIGDHYNASHDQIQKARGIDHNFIINRKNGSLTFAGRVFENNSGRALEFYTTHPGFQFYTGNFLDDDIPGKEGVQYQQRYGFCLETQHFPDSPNKPNFPSTILYPGEEYNHTTVYKFLPKKF